MSLSYCLVLHPSVGSQERVCYDNGKVMIFKEGRYAVNSPTFTVARAVDTQMQLLKFDEHQVCLTRRKCLPLEICRVPDLLGEWLPLEFLLELDLLGGNACLCRFAVCWTYSWNRCFFSFAVSWIPQIESLTSFPEIAFIDFF